MSIRLPRRPPDPLLDRLQERLDTVVASAAHDSAAHSPASEEEWNRHQHRLQRGNRQFAHRRRIRVMGIGAGLAGAVAAVTVTAVVLWPSGGSQGGSVQLVPAAPNTSSTSPDPNAPRLPISEEDAEVHFLDPQPSQAALSTWLQPCAESNVIEDYTVLWSASSELSFVVAIRDNATDHLSICSDNGSGMQGAPVTPSLADAEVAGSDWVWSTLGRVKLPDGTGIVGVQGLASEETASMTLTTIDGRVYRPVVRDGVWWANPIVRDCAEAMEWRAFDANGNEITRGSNATSFPTTDFPVPAASPTCDEPTLGSGFPLYSVPTVPIPE